MRLRKFCRPLPFKPSGDDWVDKVTDLLRNDIRLLLKAHSDLENVITWETTCMGCASLLDQLYALEVERDKARQHHKADG